MNISITKEAIDTFINKEKQNKESFLELFPSVDPNRMKKLFESENCEINDDKIDYSDFIENNDKYCILTPNNNNKNGKLNELNILEKCDSAVTLIKCIDAIENEKSEELKNDVVRTDGNKFLEFFDRSKQRQDNNIYKDNKNKSNSINREYQNEKSYISNSLVLPFNKVKTSINSLPNSINDMLSEYTDKFNTNVDNNKKNNNNNSSVNDFFDTQHETIVEKLQKLILKQESNDTLCTNSSTSINILMNDDNDNKNSIIKNENNFNDPDIILSKVKKYGEEMDQIQNEIMSNYRNQLNSSCNSSIDKIQKKNDLQKEKMDISSIDKTEQSIEEISLKNDFWRTSNLSISRKELDKNNIEDDVVKNEMNNKSNKPFLKVDNYVTWEE